MELIFRKMVSNDLDLMVTYEKESREYEPDIFPDLDESLYKEKFSKHKIEDAHCNDVILCLENNKVIGRIDIITEYSFMDFEIVGYVDWIYVQKPYRNKGIAKKLFKEAEKIFKENNVSYYYLFVALNEDAQNFYKSLGIKIEKVEKASRQLCEVK